jgi:hypothetical protein
VSQARAQAEQFINEAKNDAERRRVTAQREVDELTRQKDNISAHLAQVRQLLGGQFGVSIPGMEAAQASVSSAEKPAIASQSGGNGNAAIAAPAGSPRPAANAGVASGSGAGNRGNGTPSAAGAATTATPRPAAGSPDAQAASPAPEKKNDEDWWTQ